MDLTSLPRAAQFVASNYETRGGAKKSKKLKKNNKKTLKKRRSKKNIL